MGVRILIGVWGWQDGSKWPFRSTRRIESRSQLVPEPSLVVQWVHNKNSPKCIFVEELATGSPVTVEMPFFAIWAHFSLKMPPPFCPKGPPTRGSSIRNRPKWLRFQQFRPRWNHHKRFNISEFWAIYDACPYPTPRDLGLGHPKNWASGAAKV